MMNPQIVVSIAAAGATASVAASGVPPVAIGIAVGTIAVAGGIALVVVAHNATQKGRMQAPSGPPARRPRRPKKR